ncbi:Phenoloxidase-activating factor 1 [Gryllus bimaculatus]|nr:Phenoloxidase-activating factor 1 [Gryllus bimaculatus]
MDLLHSIQIPAVDNAVCAQLLLPSIGAGQLCAGYAEEGRNACSGDSGGPLVAKGGASGPFVQHGLVSLGPFCASPRSYVVYTNVAAEKAWIENCSQILYSCSSQYYIQDKFQGATSTFT